MKIYLAGPDVFLPDPAQHGRTLKAICARLGVEGLYPMDNEITPEAGQDTASLIRAANMAMIRACDAIVANMTPFRGVSADVGTAYEMGVGAALGKIVVGYSSDVRSYMQRVEASGAVTRDIDDTCWAADGFSVECFGVPLADNLMLSCGVDAMCVSVEQAVEEARRLFAARRA
ncbi:nucleoside 2-deoxyribosyltransferase [Lichenicola sp.]|uniref:nucleoside 2-deoxyribosyltransferase n=1 Tax=Lichenicola sp. TaxID=2804529 RepID=UPI003B0045B1